MSDEKRDAVVNDHKAGEIPEATGFDEPKPNGIGGPPADALQEIVDNANMPVAMRVIAHRALLVERNTHDAFKMGQALIQTQERVVALEQVVHSLSSQQAMADIQMERYARSTALDLAIKAVPDSVKGTDDGGRIIETLAGQFLAWMKAGTH